jgi:Protein of unknown function (DUF2846)
MNICSANPIFFARKAWPMLLLASMLGGCAGGPFRGFAGSGEEATLYIFRAPGGIPGLYPKEILVDGKPLGSLVNGGYFRVQLTPGEHVVSTPSANKAELSLRAAKGADYYISQEVIPANPPYILLNRVGEKFGKPYIEHSRRLY